MSAAELLEQGEGRFALRGVLDFSSVGGLLGEGITAFGAHRRVVLDLQGVTRSNSAALALLLEWLDIGRARGFELSFVNLPDSLLAIARMSNADALLPSPDEEGS